MNPIEFTSEDTFDADAAEGHVVLFFTGRGCGYCNMAEKVLAKADLGGMRVLKVDGNANQRLCDAFGVEGYPHMSLLVDRYDIGVEHVGFKNGDALRAWLDDAKEMK